MTTSASAPAPKAAAPKDGADDLYNSYAFDVYTQSDIDDGNHSGQRMVIFAQNEDDARAFIVQQQGDDLMSLQGPTVSTVGAYLAPLGTAAKKKAAPPPAPPQEKKDQHEKK